MIDDCWESHLQDFVSLKSYNDRLRYGLMAIYVLSEYGYIKMQKDKSDTIVAKGFKKILVKSQGCLPLKLQSDLGLEFL